MRSLFSAGAQIVDTSSYELSDLDNIKLVWISSELGVYAVFRPDVDTTFCTTPFDS